jgi:hypothetical protein
MYDDKKYAIKDTSGCDAENGMQVGRKGDR